MARPKPTVRTAKRRPQRAAPPVTIIVPYVKDGGTDKRTRLLARYFSKEIAAPVRVVNREPSMAEFLTKQFLEPVAGTPQEFAAFLKADRARIGEMIKAYNIPRQ